VVFICEMTNPTSIWYPLETRQVWIWVQISTHSFFTGGWIIALSILNLTCCHPYWWAGINPCQKSRLPDERPEKNHEQLKRKSSQQTKFGAGFHKNLGRDGNQRPMAKTDWARETTALAGRKMRAGVCDRMGESLTQGQSADDLMPKTKTWSQNQRT
jgi:putative component of membrane protein insertase Oxa1/YidC/SpoIIIJ protein YidD